MAPLLVAVLGGLVGGPAQAAEDTRPTVLTLFGEAGGFLEHATALRAGAEVAVEVPEAGRDLVVARTDVDGEDAGVLILPAEDAPRLAVGKQDTDSWGEEASTSLTIGNRAFGCNHTTGTLDVLALERDGEGRLTSLAADFVATCEGLTLARGSLRWRSDLSFRFVGTTSFVPADTGPGRTARGTVTLTNLGTGPEVLGGTSWVPVPTDSTVVPPVVEANRCAGTILAPGRSCGIDLAFVSDGVRSSTGWLLTAGGGPRGTVDTPVQAAAAPAPVPFTLSARPGRGQVTLTSDAANPAYRVLRTPLSGPGAGTESVLAESETFPWSDTTGSPGTAYGYRAVAVSAHLELAGRNTVRSGPLPQPVGQVGTFTAVTPARVLDTRDGTGGPAGALGPGATTTVDVTAGGRVLPTTGVSAVVLNVTGTEATRTTHVRVWPAGEPRPATSALNLVPGRSRPNQVVVPVGPDGRVALYNDSGSTHLVVDVQGFYSTASGPAGGGYHPYRPFRAFDSRSGRSALAAGEEVWLSIDPPFDSFGSHVAAVEVNLTVTQPSSSGHLTAWSGSGPSPTASNVNFVRGQTVANHAVVPVTWRGWEPGIVVRNSGGTSHVLVDVLGWYDGSARLSDTSSLRFSPSAPTRVLDTRTGPRPWAGAQVTVPATSLPVARAQVVNVTATQAAGGGHLTVGTDPTLVPWQTSTLNFARGEDAPNLTTVPSAADGSFLVRTATSDVHVVVDHVGFFW